MSYPYPQDRSREQREKGQHEYDEAVEAFTENEAEIEREAGRPPEEQPPRTQDDVEHDAEARFREVGDDVVRHRDSSPH